MNGASAAVVRRAQQIVADGLPIGPRLYPCVCGAGRHAHSGAARTGASPATKCRRYRADSAYDLAYRAIDAQATTLGHALREADRLLRQKHYAANPRTDGQWSIGASDTGTCPRKIQYRNKPPEDFEAAPEDNREARAGTMLHDGITARLKMLYPWREFGGKVRIPGLDRDSEFDSYDPITGEIEDYKSAGEWKWDQVGEFGPPEEVWEQTALYALAIEDSGRMVRTLRVSYYRRANGHDESFTRPYDPEVAKAALDRLLGYATQLDLGLDLPKTGTGPSNDALCRRCFARWHCWNVPEAERAGRSPESYTVLGPDPEEEAIAWTIGERVDAAAAKRDAEAEEKRVKGLLVGIEPGRYGEYEGYEKGGGTGPNWQDYAERLAELYELPEEQRPAIDTIPGPTPRRYTYIQWGRVRKATLQREARERAALEKGEDA